MTVTTPGRIRWPRRSTPLPSCPAVTSRSSARWRSAASWPRWRTLRWVGRPHPSSTSWWSSAPRARRSPPRRWPPGSTRRGSFGCRTRRPPWRRWPACCGEATSFSSRPLARKGSNAWSTVLPRRTDEQPPDRPVAPHRLRPHGHAHVPVPVAAAASRLRQAGHPGASAPPGEDGHAHDGRPAAHRRGDRRRPAARDLPAHRPPVHRRLDLRPDGDPRPGRGTRSGGRLSQRPDGDRHPGRPQAALADRRGALRRLADPAHLRARRLPRALHRRRDRGRGDLDHPRGDRDHRGVERGEHHRRPRRPGRRDAHLRVHRLPRHRPPEPAPDHPAEPRRPVRAYRRRATRVPVVQRPPRPDHHGRLRRALPRRCAGGHRGDHGAAPHPAAHRHRVRARDRLGHPPGRDLPAHRPAHLPDEPVAPPLRDGRLERGEDHHALLDRRSARGDARRGAPAGLDPPRADGVSVAATMGARLRLEDLSVEALRGRSVAVLGFARSGVALARFLTDAGARVTVYDRRPREELADQVAALEGRPAELLLGPDVDPAAALAGQDLVATSPSVSSRYPTTEPRLRAALGKVEKDGRVPVVGEVDLFLRLCPATTVGVTGTKGKTTTASLAAAVLEAGDRKVWLGGNIGVPLIERVTEIAPHDRVVLELSELQLPTLSPGTDVAVYTNVTADHLDRHGSLAAYREVKARLAVLTGAVGGLLVLNDDDPFVAALGDRASGGRPGEAGGGGGGRPAGPGPPGAGAAGG